MSVGGRVGVSLHGRSRCFALTMTSSEVRCSLSHQAQTKRSNSPVPRPPTPPGATSLCSARMKSILRTGDTAQAPLAGSALSRR